MAWINNHFGKFNHLFFSQVHQLLEDKQHERSMSGHADLGAVRQIDDYKKILALIEWFKSTDLMNTDPKKLVSFSTGETCTDDLVNCNLADVVGMEMQRSLDGGSFISKVSLKSKCKNFNALRKTLKINKKQVILAPYVLFQRMSIAAERNLTLKESLSHELTIVPASLFNDEQFMRESHKHKLGKYLKDKVTSLDVTWETIPISQVLIVDGGWLIHQIKWECGKLFSDIGTSYVDLLKRLANGRRCIAVFDGYSSSPKDHEHQRRLKNSSGAIEVTLDESKPCTVTKEKFLAGPSNKAQFIKLLSSLANSVDIETHTADNDADTLLVRKVLEQQKSEPVDVIAEDTDILVMLIHHMPSSQNDIRFITKGGTYSISNIREKLNEQEKERLLFIHAFSGCDTVSSLFRQSKIGLLEKLCKGGEDLKIAFETLLSVDALQMEVVEAGLVLFSFIYGDINVSLEQHRYIKYHQITAKTILKPEALPPTSDAATQHVLRAYLQYHDWLLLGSMTLPPIEFGWKLDSNGKYCPITTLGPVAPQELLKLTACNCKKDCSTKQCSCRSLGVKCFAACGTCNGRSCTNADIEDKEEHGDDSEDLMDL